MDNRYFRVPGRATGRLQLKRPGYGMEVGRVIEHAKTNGGAFEINSSPDRLHLSAQHTRLACNAGIKIAIPTDAHNLRELDDINLGVNQARRAGLERPSILKLL